MMEVGSFCCLLVKYSYDMWKSHPNGRVNYVENKICSFQSPYIAVFNKYDAYQLVVHITTLGLDISIPQMLFRYYETITLAN